MQERNWEEKVMEASTPTSNHEAREGVSTRTPFGAKHDHLGSHITRSVPEQELRPQHLQLQTLSLPRKPNRHLWLARGSETERAAEGQLDGV
jgi:hypothetical protein